MMDDLAALVTNPVFVLVTLLVSLVVASDNVRRYLSYLANTFLERVRRPRTYPIFWTSMVALSLSFTTFIIVIWQNVTASGLFLQFAMLIFIVLLFPYYEKRQKENQVKLSETQRELERMTELFLFSHNLHQSQYKVEDYRMTYEINEDGDVLTREYIRFTPVSETVYFYKFHLGVMTSLFSPVKLSLEKTPVVHDGNGKSLQVVLLQRTANRYEFTVILDPPCFPDTYVELTIDSLRAEVFQPLITKHQDSNRLRVGRGDSRISNLLLEIYLPENLSFKHITIAPLRGTWEYHNELTRAYARLEMHNVPSDDYSYNIFVEPRSHASLGNPSSGTPLLPPGGSTS